MNLSVALIGNPNSGKSSLFNLLTGMNQRVGNFPGVTVDRTLGTFNLPNKTPVSLIDLPGTYSLYPVSQDERIACEIIWDKTHQDHANVWIIVIDATQLRRGLLLCSQMIDLGLPIVVALNMIDMLESNGQRIDAQKLARQLEVPVVAISARKNLGIDLLLQTISQKIQPDRKSTRLNSSHVD